MTCTWIRRRAAAALEKPSCRRRGNWASANGAAEIFLQTARDNVTAQRLYERLGYQRDDEFLVYTLGLPQG